MRRAQDSRVASSVIGGLAALLALPTVASIIRGLRARGHIDWDAALELSSVFLIYAAVRFAERRMSAIDESDVRDRHS